MTPRGDRAGGESYPLLFLIYFQIILDILYYPCYYVYIEYRKEVITLEAEHEQDN